MAHARKLPAPDEHGINRNQQILPRGPAIVAMSGRRALDNLGMKSASCGLYPMRVGVRRVL